MSLKFLYDFLSAGRYCTVTAQTEVAYIGSVNRFPSYWNVRHLFTFGILEARSWFTTIQDGQAESIPKCQRPRRLCTFMRYILTSSMILVFGDHRLYRNFTTTIPLRQETHWGISARQLTATCHHASPNPTRRSTGNPLSDNHVHLNNYSGWCMEIFSPAVPPPRPLWVIFVARIAVSCSKTIINDRNVKPLRKLSVGHINRATTNVEKGEISETGSSELVYLFLRWSRVKRHLQATWLWPRVWDILRWASSNSLVNRISWARSAVSSNYQRNLRIVLGEA